MTYYRDDDEFDREQAYREQMRAIRAETAPPKMVREPCAFCRDGRVESTGGSVCPYCLGAGSFWVEER